MSQGAKNCPFLTFTALPVAAAANNKSVCRHKNAGICKTSTASAAGPHCAGSWTSVSTGQPTCSRISRKIASPASRPTPRAADAEAAALRGSQVGSGDRSEKIRTYNYKENRVTDHRIGLTIHKLDRIVAGELDEISDPLIAEERRRQLEEDE